jgi:hypothetical protein
MLKNVCLKYNFRGTEIMNETSNFMQTCKDFLHSIVFYYSEFIRVNSMLWSYGHMSVSNIVACYFEDDKLNVIYFDENYKRYEIDVKSEKFKSELVEEIRGGEKGIKKVFDMLIHERKYVNYVSKGYLELFERGS